MRVLLEAVLFGLVVGLTATLVYAGQVNKSAIDLLQDQQETIRDQMTVLKSITGLEFPEGSTVKPSDNATKAY